MYVQELIVLRAIRDANVPKFLQEDLKLFNGIVSDLFPKIKEVHLTNITIHIRMQAAIVYSRT